MEQLNVKHLFDGKLSTLSLGTMTISSALYTAYHLQSSEEFTMVTLNMGEYNFTTINILGVPVFFQHDVETNDLYLLDDIETELVRASKDYGKAECKVYVNKSIEGYNHDIDEMTEKIKKPDVFEDFFDQVIEDYNKREVTVEYDPTLEELSHSLNNEEYEQEELIEFKNIPGFDGNDDFVLDVDIEKVRDLLDDAMDIDEEISELIEMAQNMLEEASEISERGYSKEDVDDDYNDKFKDEDFYWSTTLEEDEQHGINISDYTNINKNKFDNMYNNGDDSMEEKTTNQPSAEFDERLDNLLEFMLSQSSVGHKPKYKFEYSGKGEHKKHEDEFGKFLINDVDNNTIFSADTHVIKLNVTRYRPTGKVDKSVEKSELLSDFTLEQVLDEIKINNKVLKESEVSLYTIEKTDGKVIWVANPKDNK